MKTIIYLRTSTKEQNPENQLANCKSLINEDYELMEEQQSAFKDNDREKFEKIKKRIQNGSINKLVVWDLDRIYRNRKKLNEFFMFCKVYKCQISSYNQQWLEKLNDIPPPFNEIMHSLMLDLMGWLAEDESKRKSDRVKNAVRKGEITMSYKGNKWGRKSIPIKTIKKIMELYNSNLSIRAISRNEDIFYWDKNNNKRPVGKSTVHKIITENIGKKA